ncbi:MAG: HD domain-containing protein [Lachnospiraceae bacterium]|nr:HD domain-containing protein [Lachnospiraceae bacterium]
MNFIKELQPGDRVHDIYLCKQRNPAVTKNGKNYDNCMLQDKSGMIDAKIWEPDSNGIDDFAAMDFVDITGDVSSFNGALQVSIKRARRVDSSLVDSSLYFPVSSKDNDIMWNELMAFADSVNEPHLKALLDSFFRQDAEFTELFRRSSAAKSIHHSFIGGLLEHTLSVTRLCDSYCSYRPALNRDLLITAAIFHDMGKTKELSPFPYNDYTDEGQFIGHIVTGAKMLEDGISKIDGFPESLRLKLIHCILAHHGEYEFGSPKKPALMEALALHLADNTDAKLQSFEEALSSVSPAGEGWLGFNRLFESNIYRSAP